MLHIMRATAVVVALALSAHPLRAQGREGSDPHATLDTLVTRAVAASPRLRAARARVEAAQARVGPAGTRPDPMLMAGVQNFPVTGPGFDDEMTMKMVGVSQTLVLGGKLGLARSAAGREVEAARAQLEAAALEVRRDVRTAWYEIAYADRALDIVTRNQRVLLEVARATELRYGVGGSGSALPSSAMSQPAPSAPSPSVSGEPARSIGVSRAGEMPMGTGGMSGMTAPAAAPAVRAAPASSGMESMGASGAATSGGPSGAMSAMTASTGGLQDVVRARIEATRLGEEASALQEARRATLARLNVLLERPTDAPLDSAAIPERVRRAAVADTPGEIRFTSAALGSRAAGSPLPPLAELQARAVRESPSIRAHEALIRAQQARAELAGRARVPDVDVSVEYGQRARRPDMVSAVVAIPLPIQRRRVQDQYVAGARAELAAVEAEHHVEADRLGVEVARLHGALERDRAQLALLVKAVLPQARLATDVALASFRNGRADLVTVLSAQVALFGYETTYHRTLTSFATTLATLEQTVGGEVLP